jgi:peptidoglycan hydrolase-like protein with peptidoglycan-binding domain
VRQGWEATVRNERSDICLRQRIRLSALFLCASLCCTCVSQANAQTAEQVREAQSLLIRVDRDPGPVDGVWGKRAEAALVDFLAERGLTFDGELTEQTLELLRAAPEGPAFARRELGMRNTLPKAMRNNRDQPESEGATKYSSWDIPEYVDPNPNLATLRFYLRRQLSDSFGFDLIRTSPAAEPRKLEFRTTPNRYLTAQMNHTSLLSYLFYSGGAVVHDELSPQHRFGDIVDNETGLRSNSIGKSMTSYLLGHAICQGYIKGVEARLDDWPLVAGTVYENQRLIDLVNMRAGDQKAVSDTTGLIPSGRWYNVFSVGSFARDELAGTKPVGREGARAYHYNGLATNIVLNYIVYATKGSFQSLMDSVFRDHVGIANEVYFFKNRGYGDDDGAAWYMFYATRHDYLRIAHAMLEDWKAGSCVGKYLRDIVKNSLAKKDPAPDPFEKFQSALRYGGFFHSGYAGMEKRNVLGMDGYGGQAILIDFDNGRIVVANSVHTDYDWYQLVHQVIENGALPN